MQHQVLSIFPTPVYVTKREAELTTSEMEEIKSIIEKAHGEKSFNDYGEEREQSHGVHIKDSYIFNTRLYSLKEFIEGHINTYVKEVINPKNTELDFYITQSWINVVKPGENHEPHCHTNSIISGVFYVSAIEGDAIQFYDSGTLLKNRIEIEKSNANIHNSIIQTLDIINNVLVLFPSWLMHGVSENRSSTTNRISIAFNVFVKGTIGEEIMRTELVLE